MTIIACRVHKDSIEIASDTQTTWGHNKYPTPNKADKQTFVEGKLFTINSMTLGCAGQLSDIGLMQLFCKTHSPKEMDVDSILEWLMEFQQYASDKAKIAYKDLCVHGILVSKGKAFTFFNWIEAHEIKTFDAVGSGMFLAWGALELGAPVQKAVEVAIKYDLFCGGEVSYLKIDK